MEKKRVERHLIKKSNPMWKIIDQKCWDAKNLYNSANYVIRQEFFKTGKWIRYNQLDRIMQQDENYHKLGSQASQNTLTLLDRNWKSFFKGIKDWSKKKGYGYFGKPEIPKYKNKANGRSILMVKNIQCRIENGKLIFSWKPLKPFSGIPTKVAGKLMQVRFVPRGSCYWMEIVYETEIDDIYSQPKNIAGIDLGVVNFVTMVNNIGIKPIIIKGGIIKSMNRYYNKERARLSSISGLPWTSRMRSLTDKHMNKLDYYMHCCSKKIVGYCKNNNIDTLVIGLSDGWKNGSNLGHVNNQNFVCIPHDKFIKQIQYKCENAGINCIITNEDYTSSTSFIDNELPIEKNKNDARRKKRGIFKSNDGIIINADVNASYQIIRKVFPELMQWNRGCDLHPVEL